MLLEALLVVEQVASPALEAPQAVQKVVQPVPLQVVVLVKSPE